MVSGFPHFMDSCSKKNFPQLLEEDFRADLAIGLHKLEKLLELHQVFSSEDVLDVLEVLHRQSFFSILFDYFEADNSHDFETAATTVSAATIPGKNEAVQLKLKVEGEGKH
jgi:hypothetical protein